MSQWTYEGHTKWRVGSSMTSIQTQGNTETLTFMKSKQAVSDDQVCMCRAANTKLLAESEKACRKVRESWEERPTISTIGHAEFVACLDVGLTKVCGNVW